MSAEIAIIGMSAQIVAVLSVGIALGLFIWRSTDRLDRRIDALTRDFSGLRGEVSKLRREVADLRSDFSGLSREVSELRGEFNGRFGAEPAAE